MPDFRAYAPAASVDAQEIRLVADEGHHLAVANRCSGGDPVVAFYGHGCRFGLVSLLPATLHRICATR